MMDQAIKTHKEVSFGWMLVIQQLVANLRRFKAARRAARAAVKGVQAPKPAKPMRYLAPR